MQLNVNEVMNQVETARQALTDARNHMLRMIFAMTAAGHNASELIRMQARMDEALALSQTSHDHLAVWQSVEAQRRLQHDLDSYRGDAQEDDADARTHQVFMPADYSITHDSGLFGWLNPKEHDASADDDIPYYGLFGDGEEWPQYGLTSDVDDEDYETIDDEYYDDVLDRLLATDEQPMRVILGDERADVAFDTSDMTWADQPLHDEEYRQLFGMPLTPGGDWHYDIFGNWHPGRYPSPTTDDPDYNSPW